MKTIFDVRVYAVNQFTLPVLQMIAAHNSGKTFINLAVIDAHVMTLKVIGMKQCNSELHENSLLISENNKLVLTLQTKELYELKEENKSVIENY